MDSDSPGAVTDGAAPAPAGNRRGQRSRQEILEAASRVMAVRGYAGTSMSVLARESGLPKSAFYHHFQSKAGLLAEVMARGAREFFAAMRDAHRDLPPGGTVRERLRWHLRKTGEVSRRHEDFLRLLLVLVMSSEAAEAPEAMRTVMTVRDEGRDYMRQIVYASFLPAGADAAAVAADALAHFGMAGFDGAFVSLQSGDRKPMAEFMDQLTDAMTAIGESAIAAASGRLLPDKPERRRREHVAIQLVGFLDRVPDRVEEVPLVPVPR